MAQTVVPGPMEATHDAALARVADQYEIQLENFTRVPLGWGLEAFVADSAHRAAIDAFFASGQRDFRAQSGMHPYVVLDGGYEEFGDLGMFGGVEAAGNAFRYAVLRDSGAAAADVAAARAVLLRTMDGLHWYTQITGVPGLVARGLRRIRGSAGEPPLPGSIPMLTPLRDAAGNPLPTRKTATWRADNSGALPDLIWIDDTSKDQLDGYIFALGAAYDVSARDPTIPAAAVQRLVSDARAIGARLMEPAEVAPGRSIDLVLRDADGRLTTFHDLSAEEIAPGVLFREATNGFNAIMSLGIIRTLFHITGDATLGRFYYGDLVQRRRYLDSVEQTVGSVYVGRQTNYSNVNMAFVAIYGLLRYESDPGIGLRVRMILERSLYAPGIDRDADDAGQSFFDFLYAAFRLGGTTNNGADARDDGIRTLRDFPRPPYWNRDVTNCDTAEIMSRACTAADGTVLTLSPDPGRGGVLVTVDPVPMRLRPPSNFEWRDEPHRVNGGGGSRLNPGGDFHSAYWMGRFLRAGVDGFANVSPIARPAVVVPADPDAGVSPDVGSVDARGDSGPTGARAGCACRAPGEPRQGGGGLALALVAVARLAHRGRRRTLAVLRRVNR